MEKKKYQKFLEKKLQQFINYSVSSAGTALITSASGFADSSGFRSTLGAAEGAHWRVEGKIRTLKGDLEERYGIKIDKDHTA